MSRFVPRKIVSLTEDGECACIALLECGHRRHVRHQPPLSNYPWVASEAARAERVGTPLECTRCAELSPPEGLQAYRRTATFDASSIPAGLRREHSTKAGTWGQLVVERGHALLSFRAPVDREARADRDVTVFIPPEITHTLAGSDDVQLYVQFLRPM